MVKWIPNHIKDERILETYKDVQNLIFELIQKLLLEDHNDKPRIWKVIGTKNIYLGQRSDFGKLGIWIGPEYEPISVTTQFIMDKNGFDNLPYALQENLLYHMDLF